MSSLVNVLRDEITQIVQRELKLALKAMNASAPAAPKAGKTRKGSTSAAAGGPRVDMNSKDLVALRAKLAISGPEYARLAGVSVATIYNWEKAKGTVSLRAQTAASVARLQGLTAEQARAELGPAKKRGRQPKAVTGSADVAAPRGKPGRKPGKAAKAAKGPAADAGPSVSVTGKEVTALRKKLAVSGPELARLVGVSVASIYNWEKSKDSVSLRAPAGVSFQRVQGLTAESARAELGPAKKRGRQPKAAAGAAPSEAPKKRGRPGRKPKALEAAVPAEAPKKRGRPGRKPKVAVEAAPVEAPKKRGRPGRKPKVVEAAAPVSAPAAPVAAPKKRGRPARKSSAASNWPF